MTAIALRMIDADLLKLRRKRGTLAWVLALAVLPLVVLFAVRAAQHSSNAVKYEPAGGTPGFSIALRLLCLFFGPLAAILIGVEAGAGDAAAGVFRDLVVTGRSRLALFASRVPAALALCSLVMLGAYALIVACTYGLASKAPTPDGALIGNGLGFTLLANGVVCVVAVGFAALTTSKAAATTALIGWQVVVSMLLTSISSLGSVRDGVLRAAVAHFSPVHVGERGGGDVMMSHTTALIVLAVWVGLFLWLGAWRTRHMDA